MVLLVNPENPDATNQNITKDELTFIRSLDDFDLTMLISEIHDNRWIHPRYPTVGGKALLKMIIDARRKTESN